MREVPDSTLTELTVRHMFMKPEHLSPAAERDFKSAATGAAAGEVGLGPGSGAAAAAGAAAGGRSAPYRHGGVYMDFVT